jgi:serine/threonine protein kinase
MELKSPAESARFLAEVCPGEPELREQLETLLRAHEQAGPFLKKALVATAPDTLLEKLGDRFGHYQLLQKIGEGGCGVVYMADQAEPVRRKVALKVIKLGMDTKQVIARFEAERQALALMDHPNIAKVFDAGTTDTGRPFFVMELVRGIKITDYCDQNQLSTTEGSTCSSRFARPSSMRIRKASFIATSSRRTFW